MTFMSYLAVVLQVLLHWKLAKIIVELIRTALYITLMKMMVDFVHFRSWVLMLQTELLILQVTKHI
jgi:hypothetical protein